MNPSPGILTTGLCSKPNIAVEANNSRHNNTKLDTQSSYTHPSSVFNQPFERLRMRIVSASYYNQSIHQSL